MGVSAASALKSLKRKKTELHWYMFNKNGRGDVYKRQLLALLHNQRDVLSARYRVESLLASAVVVQDQPFGKVFFLVLQKVPKFLPVRLDELYFRTGFAATATCSSLIMAAPTCLSTQTTNLS